MSQTNKNVYETRESTNTNMKIWNDNCKLKYKDEFLSHIEPKKYGYLNAKSCLFIKKPTHFGKRMKNNAKKYPICLYTILSFKYI